MAKDEHVMKYCVVAGNFGEFQFWRQKLGLEPKEAMYICSKWDIVTCPLHVKIVFWGQFWRAMSEGMTQELMIFRDKGGVVELPEWYGKLP